MDYKDFDIYDFLEDEQFVEWITNPTDELDHFWKQWLSANPHKAATIEQAKELVASIHYQEAQRLTDSEYSESFEKILKANKERNNRSFIWKAKHTYRVAVVLVLALTSLFVFRYNNTYHANSLQETNHLVSATDFGQKKTIVLADGTTVKLNSGSSLSYPEIFSDSNRYVELTGEAFFDVTKNPNKPFIIKTHNLTTKVLGTSFNIQGYASEENVSVSVLTGKVEVQGKKGPSAILLPDDRATYNKVDNAIIKDKYNYQLTFGWTTGLLSFEEESLPSIFKKLERWYGVKFDIQPGVKLEGKYSGKYKNKTLDLILQGISYTSDFNYSINNKTITIYDKMNSN